MANFLSEIISACGLDFDTAAGGVRYTVFEDGICYVEGHKGLLTFDESCALVRTARGRLCVRGENIVIRELSKGALIVKGECLRVEYEAAAKKRAAENGR